MFFEKADVFDRTKVDNSSTLFGKFPLKNSENSSNLRWLSRKDHL